jgi:hypothetical protein
MFRSNASVFHKLVVHLLNPVYIKLSSILSSTLKMAAFKQILPQNNQSLSWFPILYYFTVHHTVLYFRTTENNTEGRKWMNENAWRNDGIIIQRIKSKYSGKNLSKCHKSHMDYRGMENSSMQFSNRGLVQCHISWSCARIDNDVRVDN